MTQVGMWPSWLWGSWPLFPFGHSPTVVSSLSILHSGTSMASRCAGCNHNLVKARTNVLTFKYSFERSNIHLKGQMFEGGLCSHAHTGMWQCGAKMLTRCDVSHLHVYQMFVTGWCSNIIWRTSPLVQPLLFVLCFHVATSCWQKLDLLGNLKPSTASVSGQRLWSVELLVWPYCPTVVPQSWTVTTSQDRLRFLILSDNILCSGVKPMSVHFTK